MSRHLSESEQRHLLGALPRLRTGDDGRTVDDIEDALQAFRGTTDFDWHCTAGGMKAVHADVAQHLGSVLAAFGVSDLNAIEAEGSLPWTMIQLFRIAAADIDNEAVPPFADVAHALRAVAFLRDLANRNKGMNGLHVLGRIGGDVDARTFLFVHRLATVYEAITGKAARASISGNTERARGGPPKAAGDFVRLARAAYDIAEPGELTDEALVKRLQRALKARKRNAGQ